MTGARVFIAYAYLGAQTEQPSDLLTRLPPPIAQRIRDMRSDSARAHSLAGYHLLELAARQAGLDALDLGGLRAAGEARPQLAAGPDFNISHSRGLVACAVGIDCRVGLDVEKIRPVKVARMQRFLSPADGLADDDLASFFRGWCTREATVKASGRVGLARIAAVQIDGQCSGIDNQTWHLHYPELWPNYAACLACDRADAQLHVLDCSASLTK